MAVLLLTIILLTLAVWKVTGENVAFTVTSGYSNPPYIGFRTVVTNVGADLIQDLGTYRATTGGVYFFSFTALSAKDKSLKVSLRKNRRPLVTGFSDDVGFKSFTLNAVVKLNSGDVVYNFVEDGAIYESTAANRAFTSFTGYKIFDDNSSGGFLGGLLGRALEDNTNHTVANGTELYAEDEDPNDLILEKLNQID